jgi:hypothetical protein
MPSPILIIPEKYHKTDEAVRQEFARLNHNLIIYFEDELDIDNPYFQGEQEMRKQKKNYN